MIKSDIIRVISEYVDIDEEGLDIKLTRMKKDEILPNICFSSKYTIVKLKIKVNILLLHIKDLYNLEII